VAAVESGEAEEVEIARAGQVVARIVPARLRSPRRPGYWAGRVSIGSDFDTLPPEGRGRVRGREGVKILLDTHILLWWLADDERLPSQAAATIGDPDTEVAVSAASAWEISIEQAAGRLEAPDDLLDALAANDFGALAITAAHAVAAGRLPPHHADPFDRMLIAQAQIEGFTLISVDRRFSDYDVELLRLG
jgi:PIN domain nuclease of toxin-antitoxin system/antitoxin (DNA-binding transcriptional repressor) of toxin-antitoxin stability system